mmetsp:Transcript_8937/g.21813  ORF Transcript_8937/g.21813 Transcript_8937/m.21813 type:complete len:83 (+) Transcript_8937:214-462(+)
MSPRPMVTLERPLRVEKEMALLSPGVSDAPSILVIVHDVGNRAKTRTIKYDRPSKAPIDPPGPAGKPPPVVATEYRETHTTG